VKRVVAALALTLAGACHTPLNAVSIVEEGLRTTHALRQEPHRAAVCVARNIDRHSARLNARIREGVAPALIEVHVSTDELVALAQFFVRDGGSTAVVWTAPYAPDTPNVLVAAMVAGC
jgi:hypothetical protein